VTDSLDAALRGLGVRCTVEKRGALAVVVPAAGERAFEHANVRRQALAVLRAHGFRHAALEVGDEPCAGGERAGERS
jgi:hypothetical protein